MEKRWRILSPDPQLVSTLAASVGCQPAVATALINRGICSQDDAEAFLEPSFTRLRSPFVMKDADRAVERILTALRQREKMLIFGDYDTDGITATALLFEFLTYIDADVQYYIPDRLTEGYGLGRDFVLSRAIPEQIGLIITVDCGMSSDEAIRAARGAGIDVIITDHHKVPHRMPEALAVLNSKQPDCPSGFSWLAGVGVAFHLVLALRKRLRDEGFWKDLEEPNLKAACDLVALGTVGDMVPLVYENRIYVKAGLEVLGSNARPGIKALLDVCNLRNRAIDAQDIAFRLSPRLNAAGRVGHASTALKLLTSSNVKKAYAIAKELNQQNRRRQEIENQIFSEITSRIEDSGALLKRRAFVFHQEGWHPGVIGIVASRLVDRYDRPTVVIAVDNGIGRGSARSPEGFDLYESLSVCARYLKKFGGHETAAGFTLRAEEIPAFHEDFEKIVCERSRAEDFLPELIADGEISPWDISAELADQLSALAPFGTGNPEPLFVLSGMDILSTRKVGTRHLKMRLQCANPLSPRQVRPLDAIFFNPGDGVPQAGNTCRVACHVRWNQWRDQKRIQLIIRDLDAGN